MVRVWLRLWWVVVVEMLVVAAPAAGQAVEPQHAHRALAAASAPNEQPVAACRPACTTGATLLSFVVALVHFVTELLVFKTMSIKGAATPMVIAGARAVC
jgi:hypothetical protein